MVELKAQSGCAGLLPQSIGAVAIEEIKTGPITALLVKPGQSAALATALTAAHGLSWPAPGQRVSAGDAACQWFGRETALLIGVAPDAGLAVHAGLSDQSDAWAAVSVSGTAVEAVLARLLPIDVRLAAFPVGHAARTLCQHVSVAVTRVSEDRFEILAFRSMAGTVVHDLTDAARAVAARAAIV